MAYVDFFRRWRQAHVPIRIVQTSGEREIVNMAVLVDDFSWSLTRTGDIAYSMTVSEYEFIR